MKPILLIWNLFILTIGMPRCPRFIDVKKTINEKLSIHWFYDRKMQPKEEWRCILRLWRRAYKWQCWSPTISMWILLWYSDCCSCDCLSVKSECQRDSDCQKRIFGMPRTNASINRNTASCHTEKYWILFILQRLTSRF